jgi:hypothetical protein
MDWPRLTRKFLTSWVDAPCCRGRAHAYAHDLTRELQLICLNLDRAAVQLGVSLSWGAATQEGEKWRKLAAWVTGTAEWCQWKRNQSPNERRAADGTDPV